MTEDRIARRIHIFGKVQGVWFRAWMIGEATALGLDGWVRNRQDGSVEAVAAGSAAAVEMLITKCHIGSPASRVDRVEVEETPGIVTRGFTRKNMV
jgi:acylphosphatase